jgi:hypothetical protein
MVVGMSSAPLLSVIVPVYDVAPYLRRCLDSILAGDGSVDFEVIAVAYPVLMLAERIGVLDRICYCYRDRPGAITSTPGHRHADVFARYDQVFAFLDDHPQLERFRTGIFERMITHELGVLPRVGEYGSAEHRRFFTRISGHHRRYRPAGLPASGRRARSQGPARAPRRLPAFHRMLHVYRDLTALRSDVLRQRRARLQHRQRLQDVGFALHVAAQGQMQ